ncbi:type IX secretion system sortase PorU [Chitinophaga sp. 30R24]|uniref:type IX secretion system sortase PorU n=1 Tax=Chitinophaga sp. 30R24 TaxID=3248838 RepID=UPI003B8ED995
MLSTGQWYKLAVAASGIYKIDKALLQRIGVNGRVPTATIRLFGTGGRPLGEAVNAPRYDDLPEVALDAEDGGDGYLDDNDYLLFYAPGVHAWSYDPVGGTYTHQRNLYTDTAWYFLTVGATGLRVQPGGITPPGLREVNFDFHTFYERDSINFLNSGKQWWGQEFSKVIGLSRTYRFGLPAAPSGPVSLGIKVAARSSGGSNFNATINGTKAVSNLYLLPVTDNAFNGIAVAAATVGSAMVATPQLDIGVAFVPDNINDRGWLDYLEVQARCPLAIPATGTLDFRSSRSAKGQPLTFVLYNADIQTKIWEVTNPLHPVVVPAILRGDSLLCNDPGNGLREYQVFSPRAAMLPIVMGAVPNQNLHGAGSADMLIVTTEALKTQAERLAALHRSEDGLTIQVATVNQVYNEFAAGSPDPTAIRDYVKMYYDRGPSLRYLLLLGAASYDYRQRVKNNTNDVPSWQSDASLDALRSYVSDDYFGILRDGGDITRTDVPSRIDIGVGRIPARNVAEAALAVDKIIRYRQPAAFGAWRNEIVLVADDEDNNLHFDDAEKMGDLITIYAPQLHTNKIYVDAYPQENGASGPVSPEVNAAIAARINKGALLFNYSGHGSNARLAAENIMDAGSITAWHNDQQLPLLITATCDFAPYDDPGITSLGHKILLQHTGGAIALMTTTRAVIAASNQLMNANYLKAAFTLQADGRMPTLGTAAMLAKNMTYSVSPDAVNNRKFQLLGDPALRLAFPEYQVVTDTVNGKATGTDEDTIKGLGSYTIKGHIADAQGNALPDYNGVLYTTVYDQPSRLQTRGNDAGSQVAAYTLQQNVLFQGRQTVTGGRFTYTFIAPRDIQTGTGAGKISYYLANGSKDGHGYFDHFTTGGVVAHPPEDVAGPVIHAWLDKRTFHSGDITGPSPILLIELSDSSGINISGNDNIHNLVAILDSSEYIALNAYFEASLDNYKAGNVAFPLSELSTGEHRITIKAWDTYNNAAVLTIYFKVVEQGMIAVEQVRNYPNPFHDITRFTFLHNQQGEELQLILQVFTITGRLVKTMHSTINSTGGRYDGMPWDGRDDTGLRLPAGLYVYKLTIRNTKTTKIKGGKLVLY